MGGRESDAGPGTFKALSELTVFDLSHPVSTVMPIWPGDPPVEFDVWSTIERDRYFLRRFLLGEHSGTHLTAPASFIDGGKTVDQYLPGELVHPTVVIDVRDHCRNNPEFALTTSLLLEWESGHGTIPPGCLALLLTGWSGRWSEPGDYLGADLQGGVHFPGFGLGAAEVLVKERSVAGLGTDTAGVEPGVDESFSVSELALSRELIVLENLVNLDKLPSTGATVVIGILKLVGGSGSPSCVMALVP